MAVEKIVTLCKEGDSTTEYYPNIKADNIPVNAVAKTKLATELQNEIDGKAPQSTTYTKTETDNKLSGKVNVATYNAKVSELETAIGTKANASDVYTKTQVDDLFSSQELTLTGTSGLLTTEQKALISNGTIKRIIISDKYYTRNDYDFGVSNVIVNYTGAIKSSIISNEYVQITHDIIAIDMSTGVWTLTSNVLVNTYNKSQLDTLLNAKANSSDVYGKSETYSKTETDTLLNGKQDKIYRHNISMHDGNYSDTFYINFIIYSSQQTQISLSDLWTLIHTAYNDAINCYGRYTQTDEIIYELNTTFSNNFSYSADGSTHNISFSDEGISWDYDDVITSL